VRFVANLKRLGCQNERLSELPDYALVVEKTLRQLAQADFATADPLRLQAMQNDLLSLRNLIAVIESERGQRFLRAETATLLDRLIKRVFEAIAGQASQPQPKQPAGI
jgi:hypothetical protein